MKEEYTAKSQRIPRLNLILNHDDMDMLRRLAGANTNGNLSMFNRLVLQKVFENPVKFGFRPAEPKGEA